MQNLADYFQRLTNERSNRAIAIRAGMGPSTLNRQLTGITSLTVETVVAICRTYHLDFADVFVEVGFITADEAASFSDSFALERFTDLELAREIVRRLEAGEAGSALTEPIDVEPSGEGTITPIRRGNVGATQEDLREVAFDTDLDHTTDTDDYHA